MVELEHQIIHLEYIKTLLQTGSKKPDFEEIQRSFKSMSIKPPSPAALVEEFKEVYQWARTQGLKTVSDFTNAINDLQNKLLVQSKSLKEVFVDLTDVFPGPVLSGHRATNQGLSLALTQDEYYQIVEIIKEYYDVGAKNEWFTVEEGTVITDLCSQMGIFGIILAQNFDFVNLVESQQLSYEITKYNCQLYDSFNIAYYYGEQLQILEKLQTDIVYYDSRIIELDLDRLKALTQKCLVILSTTTNKYDNVYHLKIELTDTLSLYFWFPKGYNINKVVASDLDIIDLLEIYRDKYQDIKDAITKFKTMSVKYVFDLIQRVNTAAIRKQRIDTSGISDITELYIVLKTIQQVLKDNRTFEKLWYYYKNQLQRQKQQNPEVYILENLEQDIQEFLGQDIESIIDGLSAKYKWNMNLFYTEIIELIEKYNKREQEKIYSQITLIKLDKPNIQWIGPKYKLVVQEANNYSTLIDDMLSEPINKTLKLDDFLIALNKPNDDIQAYETRVKYFENILRLLEESRISEFSTLYSPVEWGVHLVPKLLKSIQENAPDSIELVTKELLKAKSEYENIQEMNIASDMLSKYIASGDVESDVYFNILRTQIAFYMNSRENFTELKSTINELKSTRSRMYKYITELRLRIEESDILIQVCNRLLDLYESQKQAVTSDPMFSELQPETVKELTDLLSQKPRNVIKDLRKLVNSINQDELKDQLDKLRQFDDYFKSIQLFMLHIYKLSFELKTFDLSVPKVIKQDLSKIQEIYSEINSSTRSIPIEYLRVISLEYIRFMIYFILNFKMFVSESNLENIISQYKIDNDFKIGFLSLSPRSRLKYINYVFETLDLIDWIENFSSHHEDEKYSEIKNSIDMFKNIELQRSIGDCGCKYYETHTELLKEYIESNIVSTYSNIDFFELFREISGVNSEMYSQLLQNFKLNFTSLGKNLDWILEKYSESVKKTMLELIISKISDMITNKITVEIMCSSVDTIKKIHVMTTSIIKAGILSIEGKNTQVQLSKDFWCPCLNYDTVTKELELMVLRFTMSAFSTDAVIDSILQWIRVQYRCVLTRELFIQHFSSIYTTLLKSDEEQIQEYIKRYSELEIENKITNENLETVIKLQSKYSIDKYLGFAQKSATDLTEYYTKEIKNPSVFIDSNNEIYTRLLALKKMYTDLYKPKYKEPSKRGSELEAVKNYISERYNLQTITSDDIEKSLNECIQNGYISSDTVQFVREFMLIYNDITKLPSGVAFEPRNIFDLKRYSDFPRVLQGIIQEMYTKATTNVDSQVQSVIQDSIIFNGITESLAQNNKEGAITWAMQIPSSVIREYIIENIDAEEYTEVTRYLQIVQETYRYKMSFSQSIGKIYNLILELPSTEHSVYYALDFLSISQEEKQELKDLITQGRYTRLANVFLQKFPMLQTPWNQTIQLKSSFFPSDTAKKILLQTVPERTETKNQSTALERCFHLVYYKPWAKIDLKNSKYFIAPVNNQNKIMSIDDLPSESRILFASKVYFSDRLYHPSEYFWNLYCMNHMSLVCNPTKEIIVDSYKCAVISLSNLSSASNFELNIIIGIYNFTNHRQHSKLISSSDNTLGVMQQYEKLLSSKDSSSLSIYCNFSSTDAMILKAINNLLIRQNQWLSRQFIDILDIQTVGRYLIPNNMNIELKMPDVILEIFDYISNILSQIGYPNGFSLVYKIYSVIQMCKKTSQKITNTDLVRVIRESGLSIPAPEVLSLITLSVAKLIKAFESQRISLDVLEEKLLQKINPLQYFLYTVPKVSQTQMSNVMECIDKMIVRLSVHASQNVIDMICRLFFNISEQIKIDESGQILKNLKIFY